MQEFKQLLVEHIPGLMRYAIALLGNYSSAEDLVQDCLERALHKSDQWDHSRAMKPWLFTILHNAFVDDHRRRSGSPIVNVDADEILRAIAPSQSDLLAIRDLCRQLAELAPEQREILLMVSLEGLGYKEISNIIDVPVGTVMSRLHRARKQLSLRMNPESPVTTEKSGI